MFLLASREKQFLLEVARRALTAAVHGHDALQGLRSDAPWAAPGGAFVSLHRRARLRGCVGQIGSKQPLVYVVAYCARAAALEDPRFDPVQPDELAEIEIELSILSPLAEIRPGEIEVGRHGLLVSRGAQRGVLLPQVATQFRWTAAHFLEQTCMKAGFERDAWSQPGTRLEAFTAEVFAEAEFQGVGGDESSPTHADPDYSNST